MKLALLIRLPFAVVIVMGPLVAPAGTQAMALYVPRLRICVAATPLKLTPCSPIRCVPLIRTAVPGAPEAG